MITIERYYNHFLIALIFMTTLPTSIETKKITINFFLHLANYFSLLQGLNLHIVVYTFKSYIKLTKHTRQVLLYQVYNINFN